MRRRPRVCCAESSNRRGIEILACRRTTARFAGETQVTGVELADGSCIPADLVVMAIGVQAEHRARAGGAAFRCDRGILVDDTLPTYDPAIYAVGECVQHRGSTFGLVAPLWDRRASARPTWPSAGVRGYRASRAVHAAQGDRHRCVLGRRLRARPGSESLVLRDPKRGIYKRLVIENDRIRGAVLYGDIRDSGWYFELMNEGRDIRALRDELLFGEAGDSGRRTS